MAQIPMTLNDLEGRFCCLKSYSGSVARINSIY